MQVDQKEIKRACYSCGATGTELVLVVKDMPESGLCEKCREVFAKEIELEIRGYWD